MTCVVTPGVNPLPAEVCIKYNKAHPTEFFHLDNSDWQYSNFASPHYYHDPIQEAFWKVISRALIKTFNMFKYMLDEASGTYLPRLEKPVDGCIEDVIGFVKEEIEKFVEYVEYEIEELKTKPGKNDTVAEMTETLWIFHSCCAVVNIGCLGRMILDTTHTFRANKNWNSHGSIAGSNVCGLGSVLASLECANVCDLDISHMELIPKGEVQTGAKHGNHHVSYIEYMCSNFQQSIEFGLSSGYLNHDDFRRKNHGAKVTVLMDERLLGIVAPMLRPTWAHTLDFNLNFCGMHLIDGECKDTAGNAQKAVLVLHSLNQLTYKDCAHSMITTNNLFTPVQASKNMSMNRIETHLMEMLKYRLGGVKSLNPDDDPESQSPGLAFPPPYTLLEYRFTEKDMYKDDQETMKIWRGMRSQQKSYIKCIITTIDYICALVADMPLDLI